MFESWEPVEGDPGLEEPELTEAEWQAMVAELIWVMDISGRIFGVNSWSILVPEALMGVASVGLLYATSSTITAWVEATCAATTIGGVTVYDLG
jgi:hypothetical protein